MKTTKEFSREELLNMPLIALRRLDIDTPQQQEMVQEVVNIKLSTLPPQRPVYRRDVPDIQNPKQEQEWQTIINQRESKLRQTTMQNAPVVSTEEINPTVEPVATPLAPTEPVVPAPDESGMAQPSGEGEPVNLMTGVTPMLTAKIDKRSKAYRDSLKK